MYQWPIFIFVFLFFSPLCSFSDVERAQEVHNLFEQDIRKVPDTLQTWLQKQALPRTHFGTKFLTLNFRQIAKKLAETEKHFKKTNTHFTQVLTPLQEYVLSSAPSEEKASMFWQELIDRRIKTVVALLMPADTGNHPAEYWQASRFPLMLPEWVVRLASEETLTVSAVLPNVRLVKRVFVIQGVRRDEQRSLIHLHFENWPDHGAPIHEVFCHLLDYVDTVHPWNANPILVHCAGGIGRSGTFVAAHSIRKELKYSQQPETINIPQRIIELRMQRARLVSNPCQIHAVYAAVSQLLDTPRQSL